MEYLIHAHDVASVRAGNVLQALGAIRHIAGLQSTPTRELVALFSSTSSFLKGRYLRQVRPDNEEVLGIIVPSWAREARVRIAFNPETMHKWGFEDAVRQMHSRLSGIRLPRKRRSRRTVNNRSEYRFCG